MMASIKRMSDRLSHIVGQYLPERRVFIRSEEDTRFIRMSPGSQLLAIVGSALLLGWSIIATSILMLDTIGSGNLRDQALREQLLYEKRLNEISAERDMRTAEAEQAHQRFNNALEQISEMQLALLGSDDRRREMERGIEVIQGTLSDAMRERDAARVEMAALRDGLSADGTTPLEGSEMAETVDLLTASLKGIATERDEMLAAKEKAELYAADLELEQRLIFERNDRIFRQLEDAVSLSLTPLDGMFEKVGMSPERVLKTVRSGYSGQGGPLMPLTFSTKGQAPDPDSLRANAILERLDRMNVYRIAIEKIPFDLPVKSAVRYTSGFGPRWGRMHEGQDLAGAHGTPIYATADGVVSHAGWAGGYGRLIKIKHEFGIETRYAHLSAIRVQVGQRVSRGDRIGDMGNSGRSTGTHLHYEVRVGGKAINPMRYIKAGQNVH